MEEQNQLPKPPLPPLPPDWPDPTNRQQDTHLPQPTTPLQPLTPSPNLTTDTPKVEREAHPDLMTPNYGEKLRGKVNNYAKVPKSILNLFEHDPNEIIIMQATRHPIGVILHYLGTLLAILCVIAGFIFIATDKNLFGDSGLSAEGITIGAIITVVIVGLLALVGYVAAYVYQKSRLVLTNQKVVIIRYHTLVSREVSQLNIANVEDVNVSQPGIMDRIFKTGRITIETAGEQNKYILTQLENPYEFARLTIQAHEGSIVEYGN